MVCFNDISSLAPAPAKKGVKLTVTTGGTAVDICDAPDNVTVREIDFISLRNNDSASVTATIRYYDSGTTYKIVAVTLLTLESLLYSGTQWQVLDVNGNVKYVVAVDAPVLWTPTFTFDTPGNLVVVYSIQAGMATKHGRQVHASFSLTTSTFTHTTAAGNARISGLPYTSDSTSNMEWYGSLGWGGITKATYTHVTLRLLTSTSSMNLLASGSGVAASSVAFGDMPTGGTVNLRGSISYMTA